MIKPTIGRVVWYWASSEEATAPGTQARAALVTYVHDNHWVNLTVFDRNGDQYPLTEVYLFQGEPEEERPRERHCEWMPYQKGQASKADVDVVVLQDRVKVLEALQDRVKVLETEIAAGKAKAGAGNPQTPAPTKDLIANAPAKT